jgi:RNA polymerase sigma-70 factor, ECF subfamily
LETQRKSTRFEENVLTHLDAAYNFARRLAGSEHEAEDIVQEACLRAYRFFGSFRGGNGRAWLLAIVRNTYYSAMRKGREAIQTVPLDDDDQAADSADETSDMDLLLQRNDARRLVNRALDTLAVEYREVIVLRELEDLSYKEIADVLGVPIGTVMSRLARSRKAMLSALQQMREE